MVTSFISQALLIYSFKGFNDFNKILYSKIKKTEAIRIIKISITLTENQGQFNDIINEILNSIDSGLSNELILELMDTKESQTCCLSSEIILDQIFCKHEFTTT